MGGTKVIVGGKSLPVGRTSVHRFKTVRFKMGGREYQAIQQNPDKSSRWGNLARAGHLVVQFRDVKTDKFVAVDGKVTVYGGRSGRP